MSKLNDLAIACAKKRLSPQTGYVHHCYHALPEETAQTIPLMENFLYALALLRTRTVEHVTEAKRLVEALLFFQERGRFPVYLHEYPNCTDDYQGVHLLAPLYWMLTHFHQVLGSHLKERIEQAAHHILTDALGRKSVPAPIGIKLAAAAIAFGRGGKELLKPYEEPSWMWFDPRCLGEMLIALQMISTDFSILPGLWEHVCKSWHLPTAAYAGPVFRELQAGGEPQLTVYDLFMASLTNVYPDRLLRDHPVHLFAALVVPTEIKLPEKNYPLQVAGASWAYAQHEKFAYSFMEQKAVFDPAKDKGFAPFHCAWGSPKRLHTLVCQGGNSKLKSMEQADSTLVFTVELGEPVSLEDREKCREVLFFFDLFDAKFTVDGIPANTFRAGERVDILASGLPLRFSFSVLEGEGQFMGHLMRGNRPAQIANKGVHRFEAYDWQLFIRTINRSEKCTLRVEVGFV